MKRLVRARPREAAVRTRRARGFTMIEMLAALALAAVMIAGITTMTSASLDDTRAQQAALYQARLAAAARQLVQQNYAQLAQATTGGPVVVGLDTPGPYQLASYLSGTPGQTNPYGQTPCLLIYGANPAGSVQALLVTEGGRTIADPDLGYIAANAGQGGGAIQALNNPGGAAMGAYGGWTIAQPNPGNATCSGTRTGTGHLASLVTSEAAQSQNTDYLYRVAVPGDPTANAMQVPIVLANTQADFGTCGQLGAVAADVAGNVLSCETGPSGAVQWLPQASYQWRAPVADAASLASLANPQAGDVAMTLQTDRAYTYNGKTWQALAVDENGQLTLGNTAVSGTSCGPNPASGTLVTTDSQGLVLSCQQTTDANGNPAILWEPQAAIQPGTTITGCTMIMESAGAGDYLQCSGPPSTNYNDPNFYTQNAANGTFSYAVTETVTLNKAGVIVASTWAHMNDGSCTGTPSNSAQLSQDIDILDNSKNTLAHTESQSPTLNNDSGGINNSLTQAAPAGTYNVVVTTNWATYNGITTPWTSSFCGENSVNIPNTPVAAGWTVNTYY